MSEIFQLQKNHPLVGTWRPADDFSDIEIVITASTNSFMVSAKDLSDGEEADVSKIAFDGTLLTFSLHWASTGRLVTHKFLCQSKNCISSTYTYTAQEIWQKI